MDSRMLAALVQLKQCLMVVVNLAFLAAEVMARQIFRLLYRNGGQKQPPVGNLVLLESATSLAFKIRTGKLSSSEVLDIFVERIAEVNPVLNCVVANRFEDAKKEAKEADELIRSKKFTVKELEEKKPFLGVPFTTKDCIAVKGMIHTSGLYKRRNVIAHEDAEAITALREAGAIPIALTNISELCMWWESNNTVHGRTNNPYDTTRIVGGSSGGEGCAQASCVSAFGVGSDIGGSIRMPAFFNGVFGHKPSKMIVSNHGQYPIPVSEDQNVFLGVGPLCRRAEDLIPLLKVMSKKNVDVLRLDEPVDIKKVRFMYQEDDTGSLFVSKVQPEIKELLRKVAVYLNKAHKIKAERLEIKRFKKSIDIWMNNMKNNGPNFQDQLGNLEGKINLPVEFVKSVFGMSRHTFVALLTAVLEKLGPGHGSKIYLDSVEERNRFRREMSDLLGDDGVFLYPTHPTAALYHNEPIIRPLNFSYTGIVNILALPSTHVPMGLNSEGLPIGIQIIANDKCDRLCLAVAKELEKAFGGWTPPEITA